MLRRKNGRNQNNAVHRVVAQHVHGPHLAGVVVGGVHQQQLVALLIQHTADALDHAGTAFTAEFGQDDTDLFGAAGAHHLGLHAGAVAGLLHRFGDGGFFLGAEVAAVEKPADRRLGHTCVGSKFGDIHG